MQDVDVYEKAIKSVQAKGGTLATNGLRMLIAHYHAYEMTMSMTSAALAGGYDNYCSANLNYGKYSGHLARVVEIGISACQNNMQFICVLSQDKNRTGEEQWVLYPNVAQALERLNLV